MSGTTVEMGEFLATHGASTKPVDKPFCVTTGWTDNGPDRFKTRVEETFSVPITQHTLTVPLADFSWLTDGSLNQFGNLDSNHDKFMAAHTIQLLGHYGFMNFGESIIEYKILNKITALKASDQIIRLPTEIAIAMSSMGPDASFLDSIPTFALFSEICAKANYSIPSLLSNDDVLVVRAQRKSEESNPQSYGSFVLWKEADTLFLETVDVTETQYRLNTKGRHITEIQIQIE